MLAGCGAGGGVSTVPMAEEVATDAVVDSVVPRLVDVCLERVALVMAASVETAADRTENVPAIRELVASLPVHMIQVRGRRGVRDSGSHMQPPALVQLTAPTSLRCVAENSLPPLQRVSPVRYPAVLVSSQRRDTAPTGPRTRAHAA